MPNLHKNRRKNCLSKFIIIITICMILIMVMIIIITIIIKTDIKTVTSTKLTQEKVSENFQTSYNGNTRAKDNHSVDDCLFFDYSDSYCYREVLWESALNVILPLNQAHCFTVNSFKCKAVSLKVLLNYCICSKLRTQQSLSQQRVSR